MTEEVKSNDDPLETYRELHEKDTLRRLGTDKEALADVAKRFAPKTSAGTEAILQERNTTHGNFSDNARCSQRLKQVIEDELRLRAERGQTPLTYKELESLDLICTKISRRVTGAEHNDHWQDISGYALLPLRDV